MTKKSSINLFVSITIITEDWGALFMANLILLVPFFKKNHWFSSYMFNKYQYLQACYTLIEWYSSIYTMNDNISFFKYIRASTASNHENQPWRSSYHIIDMIWWTSRLVNHIIITALRSTLPKPVVGPRTACAMASYRVWWQHDHWMLQHATTKHSTLSPQHNLPLYSRQSCHVS